MTPSVPTRRSSDRRLPEPQLVDQHGEPLPVLGEVNGVGRRAEDRNARLRQRGGQLQRRLPAELDDDADQLAPRLLDMQYLEHILDRQRLEIEPVRRVVVGRDRLRLAVRSEERRVGTEWVS